jgi:hypothetical protein
MVKHKEQYNDDIDLLELFLIFWKYKVTFASMMVIGLILGLAYSNQKITYYMTNFQVFVGHSAYDDSLLMTSGELNSLLSIGELYSDRELHPDTMPRYFSKLNKQTNIVTFEIKSLNPYIETETKKRFTKIITEALEQQKYWAGLEDKKTYMIGDSDKIMVFNPGSQSWQPRRKISDHIIKEVPIDDILNQMKINFGPTIKITPNHTKFGFFGMFAGLLLALCWMALSLFYRAIQKKIL